MKKVTNTIESSVNLREKMRRYLYSLKISIENFETIRLIISSLGTVSILFALRRRDLLINLMNYSAEKYSYEFFKQWFLSFLIFDDELTEVNKREYQDLIQHWWKQINKLPELIMKIFADIDRFIDAFPNPNYQLIFIQQMIQFIPEQSQWNLSSSFISDQLFLEHMYRVLVEGIPHIHHPGFLQQFEEHFLRSYVNTPSERFKQLSNHDNPLYHLLNCNKQTGGKSAIINRLIQLFANRIQFTPEEILRDTFEKPSRTSIIYVILFDPAFQGSQLHQKVVDQLLAIWNTWEQRGLRANEIVGWKKFTPDQRQIIQRVWDYVGGKAQKQYQIDHLIAQQQSEMEEKIRIKEKLTKCLEIYCRDACDKQTYLTCLADMDKQLESGVVRLIVIPEAIEILLPLADRLNPLEKLYSWKTFLRENRRKSEPSTPTDVNSPDIIDDESLLSDERKLIPKQSKIIAISL